MNHVLCLYLPKNVTGQRALAQTFATSTLSLNAGPTTASAPFQSILIACNHSSGRRSPQDTWDQGTVDVYLADPAGAPYTSTSLLSGEERQSGTLLYP